MSNNRHRPADQPTCRWQSSVATPAMQDALWSLAASEPERFITGCKDAAIRFLADIPWWSDFRNKPSLRFQAELIVVMAADAGIAERPPRAYPSSSEHKTSSSEQTSGRAA